MLQAVGISPHPFTPCQLPEEDGRGKYVKGQQKQNTLWGLWFQGLGQLRLPHEGFSSWWADTLKSIATQSSSDVVTANTYHAWLFLVTEQTGIFFFFFFLSSGAGLNVGVIMSGLTSNL